MTTLTAITPADQEMLDRAAAYRRDTSSGELTAAHLLALATEHGSDFATAVAYESVCHNPQNTDFIRRFQRLSTSDVFPQVAGPAGLCLVPNLGYFLDNKPQHAGAQMLDMATRLGFECFVVPTSHALDLKENARLICDTLARRPEDRIVLVSLSKGSSDLKIAFDDPIANTAFERVVAWINICGLLDGTAIVNLVLDNRDAETEAQIIGWFKQRGEGYVHLILDALRDCGHGPGRPLGGPLRLPSHVRPYHVVVFPLERHFRFEHSRILNQVLLQLGPNDCFALIADQINKPGLTFPVWGSDHYIYQAIDLSRLVAPLLQLVCEDCSLLN